MKYRQPGTPPELESAVDRWLRAEREGADNAEAMLAPVFSALPDWGPGAAFADRVLQAAGVWDTRALVRDLSPRARWATAAALFVTGLALVWLLPLVTQAAMTVDLGALVAGSVKLVVATFRGVLEILPFSRLVANLGRALWLILTSPQGALVVSLLSATTFLLWRALMSLLYDRRSPAHAAL